jgi:hypothetical protein
MLLLLGVHTELKVGLPLFRRPNLIIRHMKISIVNPGWTTFPSLTVKLLLWKARRASFQKTALQVDRVLGFYI